MQDAVFKKIAQLAQRPEAVLRTVAYMQDNMSRFLRKGEKVLICYPRKDHFFCHVLEQAILACECEPVFAGDDLRWMALLKLAFTTKSNCIVGPPLLLLGLSKLTKHMGTPLYARNVLMLGYPTTHWLVNGVRNGLDCMAWGCFDPGDSAVISGFTCQQVDGVHLWDEAYGVEILDEAGRPLPVGEIGKVVIYPRADPSLRFAVGDLSRIAPEPCPCGCAAPKLVDMDTVKGDGKDMSDLGESLLYWSSILDCRVERTEFGLELELVVFQGEKLPKLPTAAKLIVRPFNPEKDEPFAHHEVLKKRFISR